LSAFTLGSLPSLKEIQAEKTKRGLSAKSNWREIARDEQIRPDDCDTFTLIGGRGSGKTRAGAEDFMERVRAGVQRLHICGRKGCLRRGRFRHKVGCAAG
jgi:phage terminase large subunit-like protein